jgi:RNA polymerase sigma-70 factor (ECF subfamily)
MRLESQDVMQQVYLDALNNIDRFVDQGHDSFFRWLKRIALNRICDTDRKAFKTTKRAGELRVGDVRAMDDSVLNLLDHLPVSMSGPVTMADRSDRVRLLQEAIGQLSEDHRQVLEYRYLKQLTVEETAAQMERTERAIRSLSVRALIRLRELLGNAL